MRTIPPARELWRYGKPKANGRRGLKFQVLRNAVITPTGAGPGIRGWLFAAIHAKAILYNILANCKPEIVEKGDFPKNAKIPP